MAEPVFLGIDGGATKTLALAVTGDGTVVGHARGPNTYLQTVGWNRGMGMIADLARCALGGHGPAATGYAGLCGVDWPDDVPRATAILETTGVAAGWMVDNDAFNLLPTVSGATWGVVVALGTGTNIGARAPDGSNRHNGAYLAWGNSTDLAHSVMGVLVHWLDGRGEPSLLIESVPRHLRLPDAEAVVRWWARASGVVQVRKLMRPLMDAALAGDRPALAIVDRLGKFLAQEAAYRASQVGIAGMPCEVVLGGGIGLGGGGILMRYLRVPLRRHLPRATLHAAQLPSAAGAALLAMNAAGLSIDEGVRKRLRLTLPPPEFFAT